MITAPPILENQLQNDRTARAQTALWRGEMQVTALSDCSWTVDSKGSRYIVSLDGDVSRKDTGAVWACTCPDFSGRCQQFGLRCKHVEAVRLTEMARTADFGLLSQDTHPLF